MSIRDGGSAFPESKRRVENYMDEGGYGRSRIVTVQEGGLSRRDYFAAKALQGFCANPAVFARDGLASESYKMADAMLKAREAA